VRGDVRDAQAGEIRTGLRHDADPRAPAAARPAAAGRVGAEHAHLASVPLPVSPHDLDGGGLARAVRPEQGEDLATLDIEVDPAQRCHIAVALAQSPDAGLRPLPFSS
jgi:hypothetical protein